MRSGWVIGSPPRERRSSHKWTWAHRASSCAREQPRSPRYRCPSRGSLSAFTSVCKATRASTRSRRQRALPHLRPHPQLRTRARAGSATVALSLHDRPRAEPACGSWRHLLPDVAGAEDRKACGSRIAEDYARGQWELRCGGRENYGRPAPYPAPVLFPVRNR